MCSVLLLSKFVFCQEEKLGLAKEIDAINAIHQEFDQYIARRQTLFDERDRIQQTIKETEQEFQKLANASLKRQMDILALQWEQNAWRQSAIENTAIEPRQARSRSFSPFDSSRASTNSNLAVRDQLLAGIDLMQLDAAARVVVQRRLSAFQDGQKWHEAMNKWMSDGPAFFSRYWRFTDPCLILSQEDSQQYLIALRSHSVENISAKLAVALLELRLGDRRSAMKSLDQVIELKSPLQAIAIATRGLSHGLDSELRKAKTDMSAAMKMDGANAYVRFLRGRFNAIQKDWSSALQDMEVASRNSDLSIDAHRNLVLIGLARAESNPKLASKVVDSMTLLQGFIDDKDWHMFYLKAWQGKFSTDKEKAIDQSRQAEELATGDKKEVCVVLTESIANRKPNEWDFAFGKPIR
jgi:hypothetical protein